MVEFELKFKSGKKKTYKSQAYDAISTRNKKRYIHSYCFLYRHILGLKFNNCSFAKGLLHSGCVSLAGVLLVMFCCCWNLQCQSWQTGLCTKAGTGSGCCAFQFRRKNLALVNSPEASCLGKGKFLKFQDSSVRLSLLPHPPPPRKVSEMSHPRPRSRTNAEK